jgi:hypothetical protein
MLQEEATSEVPKAEVVTSPAAVDNSSGEEENAVESQPAHKPGQKPTKQYALKRYMKPEYFCHIYWSSKTVYLGNPLPCIQVNFFTSFLISLREAELTNSTLFTMVRQSISTLDSSLVDLISPGINLHHQCPRCCS